MSYRCYWSFFFIWIASCNPPKNGELTIRDVEIFQNTPAYELAMALEKKDFEKSNEQIDFDSSLVDTQDPIFGTTLLMRAVCKADFEVVIFLLGRGADPNIVTKWGNTALFMSISDPWGAVRPHKDDKIVEALLTHGADPNYPFCAPESDEWTSVIECGTSPLMHAATRGIEKVKALIEFNAELDYKNETKKTEYEPVNLLLRWFVKLDSKKHRLKLEIIDEFKNQGFDYWSLKKGPRTIERAKKTYPDNWQEYLAKY